MGRTGSSPFASFPQGKPLYKPSFLYSKILFLQIRRLRTNKIVEEKEAITRKASLGVPAIKQVKSKGIAYFLGYVFFDEQIQGLLGFKTMN